MTTTLTPTAKELANRSVRVLRRTWIGMTGRVLETCTVCSGETSARVDLSLVSMWIRASDLEIS